MKAGGTIILIFFFGVNVIAQIDNAELYRQNAVMLTVEDEVGSGFICSKKKDSVFVLSAYHVVDHHKGKPIKVTFADGRVSSAHVVFSDPVYDLVMIGMELNNFKWIPVPVASDVELGDQVYYVSLVEEGKPLLPRGSIATIDRWDYDKGIQFSSMRGVAGGVSGSALLCDRGIAGIIQTQEVRSLDIHVARQKILAWDKTKWQLDESK